MYSRTGRMCLCECVYVCVSVHECICVWVRNVVRQCWEGGGNGEGPSAYYYYVCMYIYYTSIYANDVKVFVATRSLCTGALRPDGAPYRLTHVHTYNNIRENAATASINVISHRLCEFLPLCVCVLVRVCVCMCVWRVLVHVCVCVHARLNGRGRGSMCVCVYNCAYIIVERVGFRF